MSFIDKQIKLYIEETYEHLAKLEDALLELEETPDDMELIGCVFRELHTIKRESIMFGFNNIVNFTHEVETIACPK